MPAKRGAPKGNRNAVKHGFYSNAYTQEEKLELQRLGVDPRQSNFKFFKVLVARAARWVKPDPKRPLTFHENLAALQTLTLAVSRLQSAVSYARERQLQMGEGGEERQLRETLRGFDMTDEEIDREFFGIVPPRQPGAQPGNQNALKHGFYASHYTPAELRKLDGLDETALAEEITLLQVLMKRVLSGLDSSLPLHDRLKAVRILSRADACLHRLTRTSGDLHYAIASLQNAILEAISSLDPYNTDDLE
jgi:hypothetical protein